MKIRITITKELEPIWGAEDLLADYDGKVTPEFCEALKEFTLMEDFSSVVFEPDEGPYKPEIKLEVIEEPIYRLIYIVNGEWRDVYGKKKDIWDLWGTLETLYYAVHVFDDKGVEMDYFELKGETN